jgi:hypothetical protein
MIFRTSTEKADMKRQLQMMSLAGIGAWFEEQDHAVSGVSSRGENYRASYWVSPVKTAHLDGWHQCCFTGKN